MSQDKIDKNTNIEDLLESYPEANEVLYEYGLYCGNCFAAGFDNIEDGAKMHGLEDDEIEELVEELRKKTVEIKKAADAAENKLKTK